MLKRITKRTVDQLNADQGDAVVWDTEVKGFGARVRKSGTKYYVVKMRVGARQRWITIGRHGSPWTPDGARREALRLIGLKAGGQDPAAKRDQHKGVVTVAELGDRFLKDYVPQHCKPKTAYDYRRSVESNIAPSLGRIHVTDLTRADVARLHHEMRGRRYEANRALQVLSKMMNLAEEWGLRPDSSNPCRHVRKYKEVKRERYLSADELECLGEVLAAADTNSTESPFVTAAIRLLILTGARLSEILTLKWEYVDIENGVLRLPDSKTGAKPIYLNTAAIDLLRGIPKLQGNDYVIAGSKPGAHMVNLQKPWGRIRSTANIPDVRIHDLRHSFASVAAGSGLSMPMIGALLGHSQPSTTARYAHLAIDPMRNASDLVGAAITASLNSGLKK